MKSISVRFRPIFLAVLFIFGFATLTASRRADAQQIGKAGHEIDYYSDATHTHQVGFIIFCKNGQTIHSGQVSQFSVVVPAGC